MTKGNLILYGVALDRLRRIVTKASEPQNFSHSCETLNSPPQALFLKIYKVSSVKITDIRQLHVLNTLRLCEP
jgi:hypothetical protein